jgi:CDGSH-type Zn-finger protein
MPDPVRASETPFSIAVEESKNYWWCTCGKSQSQPFCDGSHKGSEFTPVKYQATATKNVFFCGCKRTLNAPLCDGSHNK